MDTIITYDFLLQFEIQTSHKLFSTSILMGYFNQNISENGPIYDTKKNIFAVKSPHFLKLN